MIVDGQAAAEIGILRLRSEQALKPVWRCAGHSVGCVKISGHATQINFYDVGNSA